MTTVAVPSLGKGRGRGGFTLVEILASLLFLAITVPAIVAALGLASRTSELAERASVAGELAQNKLNEMLVDSAWRSAAQNSGDFGPDLSVYRWQMTTASWTDGTNGTGAAAPTSTPATASSNSSGNSTGAAGTGTNSLTELAVEVFYKLQGDERSVRLTTVVTTSATSTTSTTGTSTSTP